MKKFLLLIIIVGIISGGYYLYITFPNLFDFLPCSHSEYTESYVEATCEGQGSVSRVCNKCGETIETQTVKARGHYFKTIKQEPTCTEEGYEHRTECIDCGKVEDEGTVIPAYGHTIVDHPYQAPSCVNEGNEAYQTCSVCNEELVKKVTIPAKGHGEIITVSKVEPTCTETGLTEGERCFDCLTYLTPQSIIPALGHNLSSNYCNRCDIKFYNNASQFLDDCYNDYYNKNYSRLEIELSYEIENKTITFPSSVSYVKLIGSEDITYKNVSFEFESIGITYLILENVKIETKGTIIKAGNALFLYAVKGDNILKVTSVGKKGADGTTILFGNGTDGEDGGRGDTCCVMPSCSLYVKGGNIYIYGGQGGAGGDGGSGSGIWNVGGDGGNGGQGGNAFAGYLSINEYDANDLYSHQYEGSGYYVIEGGAGGKGGHFGLGGGTNGSNGASGNSSLN